MRSFFALKDCIEIVWELQRLWYSSLSGGKIGHSKTRWRDGRSAQHACMHQLQCKPCCKSACMLWLHSWCEHNGSERQLWGAIPDEHSFFQCLTCKFLKSQQILEVSLIHPSSMPHTQGRFAFECFDQLMQSWLYMSRTEQQSVTAVQHRKAWRKDVFDLNETFYLMNFSLDAVLIAGPTSWKMAFTSPLCCLICSSR